MTYIKQTIMLSLLCLIGMSAYAQEIPNNEIWYEASEILYQTPYSTVSGLHYNAFGVSITSHTFSNGKGIVTFSGDVTSIGYCAFLGCSGLTSITIPNSVTSIGEKAFYGCSGLTSITIPNSVTSIESYTFSGCSSLTSITIPNSVTSIDSYAFNGCSSLTGIAIPNSVISIGNWAFCKCSGLTSITIPNSVTSIGYCAFLGCSGLTSITIPNSVTSIDSYAFNGCSSLPIIDNIRYADTFLVEVTDKSQSSYSIKEGTRWIGYQAFEACSNLIGINLPNSVTSIGDYAFQDCSSLTRIDLPNSVTSIGDRAFQQCSNLTSIKIPNSVTSIESYTFSGCSSLTSITIPNSVTYIGSAAFSGTNIESITFPESISRVSGDAFYDCNNLTTVITTNIGSWCQIDFEAEHTMTGSHDTTNPISQKASLYYNDNEVKDLVVPSGVTKIGDYNFYNYKKLTSITLPNTITEIGQYAFSGCGNVSFVKVNWSRPLSIGTETFHNIDKKNCTLYVPKGTFQMYASAPVWMDFTNIKEFDDGEDVHYIAIKQAGGCVKQHVELGNTYQYTLEVEDGWEINSVSFNGIDVTGQLYNGMYSTPIITGNSELNVVFRQMSDGVKDVSVSSDVKVRASGNVITVSGAEEDDLVEVYSFSGALVKRDRGNVRIVLDAEGVYIIKVGNDSFKVRL